MKVSSASGGWPYLLSFIKVRTNFFFLEPVQSMRSDVVGNQMCDCGNNDQCFVLRQNREWIYWLVIHASQCIYWYMIQSRYQNILVCDTSHVYIHVYITKKIFVKPTQHRQHQKCWELFHLTGSDRVQNAEELNIGGNSTYYLDKLSANQKPGFMAVNQ